MTLQEVKIKALKKGTTMTQIARELGISRQHLYRVINKPGRYADKKTQLNNMLSDVTKIS